MMKLSTSLIRIRYAVGVMLALSAVFAVVIGTSTLQTRDVTAQDPPPAVDVTISLSVDDAELREGSSDNKTAVVTVSLSAAADASVDVPVTLSGDAARPADYSVDEETQVINNDSDLTVTIPEGESSRSITVTINDDPETGDPPAGEAEGTETITIELGTAPTDSADPPTQTFTNDADDNSVSISVLDEENSAPAGSDVTISDDSPTVGDELTASFSTIGSLTDADGKTSFENGPDGQSGTTVDNNSPIQYQWGHLGDNPATNDNDPTTDGDVETNFFLPISGATNAIYTVKASDAGKVLAVRAGFADDAGFDMGDGNYIESDAATAVLNSVSLSVDNEELREGSSANKAVVTITLSAPAPTDGAEIPLTVSGGTILTDYSVDEETTTIDNDFGANGDVTIAAGKTTGSVTITINDDETGDPPQEGEAEGTETITVELGTAPNGYANGEDDEVMITVLDEENSEPTGFTVNIQTGGEQLVNISGNPAVGDELTATATFNNLNDNDGSTTFENGPDGDADEADDNNSPVQYQWGHFGDLDDDAQTDDEFRPISGANGKTYTVRTSDAAMDFRVRIGFVDDAGFNMADGNYAESASTEAVLNSINLRVDRDELREGGAATTAVVTITLSAPAPANGVTIDLDIGTGDNPATRQASAEVPNDYAIDEETTDIDNDSDLNIAIGQGENSGSVTITINEDEGTVADPVDGIAEGTETVTIELGSTIPDGFTNGDDASVTITVYDEENSGPTGSVTIDDTAPTVGDKFTATAEFSADADGITTFQNGPDGQADTLDDNSPVQYQWGHHGDDPATTETTEDDFFLPISGATGKTYTVQPSDAGKVLAARAGFEDDARFDMSDGNSQDSAATTAVSNSVTLSVDKSELMEGSSDDTAVVTATLSAPANAAVTIPLDSFTGTAQAADYSATATSMTLSAGETIGTIAITIIDDELQEAGETIIVTLDTAPNGYANGSPSSVMITILDDENSAPTGAPVIKVGSTIATARAISGDYVTPGTDLIADVSGVGDPDGITTAAGADGTFGTSDDETGGDAPSYQWGTLNANGVFTEKSGATDATYEVLADDGGMTLAVQYSFSDDERDDGTTRVEETVTSAGVDAAIVANFDKSEYTITEGESVDIKVTLSDAPASGVVVLVEVMASSSTGFSLKDGATYDSITMPTTLRFVGDDSESEKTLRYTSTADGPGRRTVTLTLGDLSTGHEAGGNSPATIVIRDTDDSSAAGTLKIDNTSPMVGDELTATLSGLSDPDGLDDPVSVTFTWSAEDSDNDSETVRTERVSHASDSSSTSNYTVKAADVGKVISVTASFSDQADEPQSLSAKTSAVAPQTSVDPFVTVSHIEAGIRGVTLSSGDEVTLSVNVFGLQNKQDQSLAKGVNFVWTQDKGSSGETSLTGTEAEIKFTAPDAPGSYDVTALLSRADCYHSGSNATDDKNCSATFEISVRRSPAAPVDGVAPQNPPGEIPTLLTDDDGNQYEVFTPEGGGTFTGESYTLTAGAGAIPNGEYIGIRVSDEGSASNAGMTHQRYTLGGNMYSVSAVDASNADITSYALNSAATVCVPLPDELRSNISNLALVAINADGSLTILSASVRLGSNGTQVCGNLSGLPASVAVGSAGAPAPPTTPVPPTATPEAPDTGGAAPTSNAALWALLLGFAVVASGTFLVIGRRRESSRK